MTEEMKEFEKIVRPVVEYLQQNYHPHASIIITQTNAEIVEGVMALPFEPND